MFNEGNQIHNLISSSGSGTIINYGSGSGSDFFTSYGSGSGSTSQKVTVPTVPVPVPVPVPQHWTVRVFSARRLPLPPPVAAPDTPRPAPLCVRFPLEDRRLEATPVPRLSPRKAFTSCMAHCLLSFSEDLPRSKPLACP